MTHAELTDAVRASDIRPDRNCDRHNSYVLSRGSNAERAIQSSCPSRVQASRPEETGSDGRGATPAPIHCRNCGRQHGTYTTDTVLGADYTAKSSWTGDMCPTCAWDRDCEQSDAPTPRPVPGTQGRRHA